jgi:hypothetical protein
MKSRVQTLQRISAANQAIEAGAGISDTDYILLCKYHSRSVAAKLKKELLDRSIDFRTSNTRMFVNFEVAFKDKDAAASILETFRVSNQDLRPRSFSRDYDLVILIVFVTVVASAITAAIQELARLTPLAILATGVLVSIVVERLHRQYRLRDGQVFTLRELLIITTLIALNLAAWQWLG